MSKTLKVYVLYGEHEAIQTVASRLLENEMSFSYSGEYLYSSCPWDYFIDHYCQDIKDQLRPCEETWGDLCLNFDYKESEDCVKIYVDGQHDCSVYTNPSQRNKFLDLLGKLSHVLAKFDHALDWETCNKKFEYRMK